VVEQDLAPERDRAGELTMTAHAGASGIFVSY